MVKRQEVITLIGFIISLLFLAGCAPHTPQPPEATQLPFSTPSPTATMLPESSPTPDPCLGTRGQVARVAFDSPSLPYFYIYLPECYASQTEIRYPVLYLLHGQGYEADQWLRLGAADQASALMAGGEASAYIIVMPYDKASWRGVDVDEFGDVLVNEFIPFIDANYRTLTTRESRAIGGLSRGAGWAIRYGLTHPERFGAIGAHSPAIFYRDFNKLDDWLAAIPAESLPQVYLDIGDQDGELGNTLAFAELLHTMNIVHEWHLFTGSHDEIYWQAHVGDYMRWYGKVFE